MVDNKIPEAILKEARGMISGSTDQYLKNQGLKFILADKKQNMAEVKIKLDDKIYTKNIKRELVNYKEKHFYTKKITNNIVYFKVPVWRNIGQVLEQKLAFFFKNGVRVLIIDLRGNMGGNSAESDIFTSHLFRKKVLFGTAEIRSSNKNLKLKKHYYFINPSEPYWNIPIILIVDSECFSSSELFIAGMKDNKRALVIGETTGGGTGNPRKFAIPCGKLSLELFVSTWNYQRINGQSIEGRGVEPNIFISPILDDLLKGKDVVLERAVLEAKKLI
ncbi:MAG: peptidase, S41 family protein [Parcubacteria group bacterium Athens0714_26]|nr:MAG: peptidase, S41 family protein [Parcubacteria group bacterium Athens0714_26]